MHLHGAEFQFMLMILTNTIHLKTAHYLIKRKVRVYTFLAVYIFLVTRYLEACVIWAKDDFVVIVVSRKMEVGVHSE